MAARGPARYAARHARTLAAGARADLGVEGCAVPLERLVEPVRILEEPPQPRDQAVAQPFGLHAPLAPGRLEEGEPRGDPQQIHRAQPAHSATEAAKIAAKPAAEYPTKR